MSKADFVAGVLMVGATAYAVFAGADFGAGLWQLAVGRSKDPEAARGRIERSVAPVWEANHTWLIFVLVVLWTAFPSVFSAIFTTLYIPLALAVLGVVLRGAGFAFGKLIEGRAKRAAGVLFEVSSVLTPFFMGTVVGAIASGRVPAGGNGDPMGSWTGLVPLAIGALFVVTGAYLAAVFLTADSAHAGEAANERLYARCALGAAGVAGVLAIFGLVAVHADASFLWDGLTGPALPLVIASVVAGGAGLALLARAARNPEAGTRGARPLAVAAVVAVVWGWGVAQHPYLLTPGSGSPGLRIDQAASPDPTLVAVIVVLAAALVIVVPALALLFSLVQRDALE